MICKAAIIVIEGDTEVEFFDIVVKIIADNMGDICKYKIINAKGIGNYYRKVPRKILREVENFKRKYNINKYDVVLTYDTDVNDYSPIPRFSFSRAKKIIVDGGARHVYELKVEKSIEDWFLIDINGVLNYLSLPTDTPIKGRNGYEKITRLFKKTGKIYVKGEKTEGFIKSLDIPLIVKRVNQKLMVVRKVLDNK